MKRTAIFLLAIIASAAVAQEQAPPPDYSREHLQRFVAAIPEEPPPQRRIRFYWGTVEFAALGQQWRFNPVMAPLSGSIMRTTQEWPDPFSLSGTPIATPKRAWRTQRKLDAELRRIEKSERVKIQVNVK